MDFTLTMRLRTPTAVLTAGGELDVFTSQQLRERLQDAVDLGCSEIHLDLAAVTFADASALRVIDRFQRQLYETGGVLRFIAWSPQVLRLCRMARLDDVFGLADPTPA